MKDLAKILEGVLDIDELTELPITISDMIGEKPFPKHMQKKTMVPVLDKDWRKFEAGFIIPNLKKNFENIPHINSGMGINSCQRYLIDWVGSLTMPELEPSEKREIELIQKYESLFGVGMYGKRNFEVTDWTSKSCTIVWYLRKGGMALRIFELKIDI